MNHLSNKEKVVEEHKLLVKKIAFNIFRKLPPSVVVDDLIQDGMMGLLKAIEKYNPSLGSSFETYAGICIRGAILDELRKNNILPRGVAILSGKIKKAEIKVQNKKLRPATNGEIAEEMDIPIKEFHKILSDIQQCSMMSTEDPYFANNSEGRSILDYHKDNSFNPEMILEIEEFVEMLNTFIKSLPEKEKTIFVLHEMEGLSEKDIGILFGISISRTSQILKKAKNRWQTEQFMAKLNPVT